MLSETSRLSIRNTIMATWSPPFLEAAIKMALGTGVSSCIQNRDTVLMMAEQIQAGAQIGVLLNAQKTSGGKDSSITSLMNRFDYGFAAGVEVCPFKGLIIGTRYNLGLGKMYKEYDQTQTTPYPLPFDPSTTNLKNGILQLFIGYRF